MIAVIIIVLVVFSGPVYMYIRAGQVVSIDVQALDLDEIVEIGTKTSESALRRLGGRSQAFPIPKMPGSVGWQAQNGRVLVSYLAMPLPGGAGYRVGATARPEALFRTFSIQGLEQAMLTRREGAVGYYIGSVVGSWLGQKIWLWSHARKVLYRRWRTLGALKRADAQKVAALTPPQAVQPSAPSASPAQQLPSQPGADTYWGDRH